MGEVVFIGWFPSRFRLKNCAFSSNMQDKLSKKLFPPALARVLEVEWHLGACERNFSHPGACSTHLRVPTLLGRTFSPFSSSFWVFSFIKLVLGLRIEFFFLFVVSSEASWFFIQGFPKSYWDVLLCRFAWFCSELHQKHPRTIWFREN